MPILVGSTPTDEDREVYQLAERVDLGAKREIEDADLRLLSTIFRHWPVKMTRRQKETIRGMEGKYLDA